MAIGDVYRTEIHQQAGSVPTMNVLHVRQTVAEAVDEDIEVAIAEMITTAYTALAANLSVDWRVISVLVRNLTGLAHIPEVLILGAAESIEGGVTGDMVPSNAPALISLYTNRAGRSGRGRLYLPGWPEANQSDGQMTEAAYTAFEVDVKAQFEGEKGPFLAGAAEFRFHVFTPIAPSGTNASDVVKAVAHPNLATMRTRRAHPGFAT